MQISRPANVPAPTVRRLSLYLRELEHLRDQGVITVRSRQLGQSLHLTDAQVRKDLAHFGPLGHPGVGYDVVELIDRLRRILGTDHQWTVALVGVGNLGQALLRFGGFAGKGLRITHAFDADPTKIGQTIGDIVVRPLSALAADLAAAPRCLALVSVPPDQAQDVANALVAAGIEGILNFSAVSLNLPRAVAVQDVDLAAHLEQLAFQANVSRLNHTRDD